MKSIAEKQELFFKELQPIQELAVLIALSDKKKGCSLEEALYCATCEAICGVLTLIDGYSTDEIKLDLIDKETGLSLRENIELHDKCVDYLRC